MAEVVESFRQQFDDCHDHEVLYWAAMTFFNAANLAANAGDTQRGQRLYSDALQAISEWDFADARTMESAIRSCISPDGDE